MTTRKTQAATGGLAVWAYSLATTTNPPITKPLTANWTRAKIMRLSPETIIEITGRKQRTALAHTDQATTRGYLLWRETPVYEVVMRMPNGISANKMGNK